jgi:threonine/homoserine/homoserine lactone efflux protein
VFEAATLLVYLTAAVGVILSPGPDTAYVLARGAADGREAGLFSALGVSSGILVHTAAAALGLAALFEAVPSARSAVTALGGLYLAYLGVQSLRESDAETREPAGNPYLQGAAVNVLNPQVALFFLAFLPAFAPASSPAAGMLVLGAIYAAITALYLGAVGVLSGRLGGETPRLRRLSGVVLLGLAAWVLATSLPT